MKDDQTPEPPEKLLALLAVKRHEQPPPGYFDRLPGQIRRRIASAEADRPQSWWERWFSLPLPRPAVGWAYAGLAAVLVVGGLGVAQHASRRADQANAVKQPVEQPQPSTAPVAPPVVIAGTNGTSSPPSFLTQPGGSGLSETGRIERAGFKQ
jgi:hypothetical protein